MKRLLCFFGLHKWRYFADGYGRQCQRRDCFRWEFRSDDFPWTHDLLGSGYERDGKWDDEQP